LLICLLSSPGFAANQTLTTTPVIVSGNLPYSIQLDRFDPLQTIARPSLHSFVAGEFDGQWVLVGGLSNGLHGFDIDRVSIEERFANSDVWVIDPVAQTSWNRSLLADVTGGGLTNDQLLSLTSANAQFEQVGDRLYVTGGYGDNDVVDPTSRDTFSNLTAFDLPGLADWAKGGAGMASDHIRQISDPLFKVTGGDMYEVDGQMQLVFGQDFNQEYQGNQVNGEYTKHVRTFTIQDDGTSLNFTHLQSSPQAEHFRRRDLNIYPTVRNGSAGDLEKGLTVLSGVFTLSRGAWTVPVEIDASGNPTQIDLGNNPLNANGELDNDPSVFKQGMNNYHSAKFGLFSELTGDMHELLFGGITLQEYDPSNPNADENGFVTDNLLPNTRQISSVIRTNEGSYEQHFLGEYPELYTDEPEPQLMRFGSNAEFFVADGISTFDNGVINLDALPVGETTVGYIFGGIITNAPHVFGNPTALSSASGEIFAVTLTRIASGDFDGDGDYACADVDALVSEIASGNNSVAYDLTGDSLVDQADLVAWLAEAGAAELPSQNPYLAGDANLDGTVDGVDFLQWNTNKFTSGDAGFCGGDFTADGSVDGADFIAWNTNKFSSADVVPEPLAGWVGWCVVLAFVWRGRGQR
jgi:hypothetical protein